MCVQHAPEFAGQFPNKDLFFFTVPLNMDVVMIDSVKFLVSLIFIGGKNVSTSV